MSLTWSSQLPSLSTTSNTVSITLASTTSSFTTNSISLYSTGPTVSLTGVSGSGISYSAIISLSSYVQGTVYVSLPLINAYTAEFVVGKPTKHLESALFNGILIFILYIPTPSTDASMVLNGPTFFNGNRTLATAPSGSLSVSVSACFRQTAGNTGFLIANALTKATTDFDKRCLFWRVSSTQHRFFHDTTNSATSTDTALSATDSLWHSFVAVFENRAVSLYRDDVLVSGPVAMTTTARNVSFCPDGLLTIGARSISTAPGYTEAFSGDIMDVTMWARALKSSEVSTVCRDVVFKTNCCSEGRYRPVPCATLTGLDLDLDDQVVWDGYGTGSSKSAIFSFSETVTNGSLWLYMKGASTSQNQWLVNGTAVDVMADNTYRWVQYRYKGSFQSFLLTPSKAGCYLKGVYLGRVDPSGLNLTESRCCELILSALVLSRC